MIPKECKRLAEVDFPIARVSVFARARRIRESLTYRDCTYGRRLDLAEHAGLLFSLAYCLILATRSVLPTFQPRRGNL